jgi:hypothetical protein
MTAPPAPIPLHSAGPALAGTAPPGAAGRALVGLLTAALLAAGLVAAETSPRAAHAAACSGTSGVTVVVDFTAFGGAVEVECATGDPASGLAALTAAGFSFSFVPGFPGFVCRIDGLPDPCNGAPATAFWSYWHAEPGGTWTFSTSGAGTYDPAPGTVEGWAFGAGDPPGISPP